MYDIDSVLVSRDEKVLCCLGRENLRYATAEGDFSGQFVLLTDQRMYLKGKGLIGRNIGLSREALTNFISMRGTVHDRDYHINAILKAIYHDGAVGTGIWAWLLFSLAGLVFCVTRVTAIISSGGPKTLALVAIYAVLILVCLAFLGSMASQVLLYRQRYIIIIVDRAVYGIIADEFAEQDIREFMTQWARIKDKYDREE